MIKRIKTLIKSLRSKQLVPIIVPVEKEAILKGKVALITGGSSGIGFSIADSFLKSGAKVILVGSNAQKLAIAKEKLGETNVATLPLDIADIQAIPPKIAEALTLFPEKRIDILVNSAGTHHSHAFEEMTEEEYDRIMDVNVKGTFFICQAVCSYMKRNNIRGHVLNLSSSSALRPSTGPYHLSKLAITGLTRGLAELYQPYGITVNAIGPGQTATPMLSKGNTDDISNSYAVAGRYIMPEEIASLATFMVSGMADMIVGDTVYMTGGSGVVTFNG